MSRKQAVLALLLLAVVSASWWFAGYAAGKVAGRGWRGVLVDAGCRVVCPLQFASR